MTIDRAENEITGGRASEQRAFPNTMNTEHTPGPWRVNYAQSIIATYGIVVAHVEANHSGTPSPDARLIAAAPDLLEALKYLLSQFGLKEEYVDQEAGRKAAAAIAKAEGKQHSDENS